MKENYEKFIPFIEKKQIVLDHRKNPLLVSNDHLKFMKTKVQEASETSADKYLTKPCLSNQKFTDTRHVKIMYKQHQSCFRPSITKLAPQNSENGGPILDRNKLQEKWLNTT